MNANSTLCRSVCEACTAKTNRNTKIFRTASVGAVGQNWLRERQLCPRPYHSTPRFRAELSRADRDWSRKLDGLARMLHEGGPVLTGVGGGNNDLRCCLPCMAAVRFVLFGFRPRWALHLDRSASKHSCSDASAADRSTCFTHHALYSEPFMQHAD